MELKGPCRPLFVVVCRQLGVMWPSNERNFIEKSNLSLKLFKGLKEQLSLIAKL